MSSQFVGRRADGTLVLLSSQEPRPDYLAIYRLDFRAHYFDVRVETLLFHDDPLKGHNGHYIGPYAYLFYHSTPENRPSYGSFAGYDNYSFDSWYAFLPYETLSNVHVKISLVFPLPRGLKAPVIADQMIPPTQIPLTPNHCTFLPEWFESHQPDPDDIAHHNEHLDPEVEAIPVTTPQEAPTLSPGEWNVARARHHSCDGDRSSQQGAMLGLFN